MRIPSGMPHSRIQSLGTSLASHGAAIFETGMTFVYMVRRSVITTMNRIPYLSSWVVSKCNYHKPESPRRWDYLEQRMMLVGSWAASTQFALAGKKVHIFRHLQQAVPLSEVSYFFLLQDVRLILMRVRPIGHPCFMVLQNDDLNVAVYECLAASYAYLTHNPLQLRADHVVDVLTLQTMVQDSIRAFSSAT